MNYQLETLPGDWFAKVAEKARTIAFSKNVTVKFDFNGIKCIVDTTTNLDRLNRDYENAFRMKWKTVGPDCLPEYSLETQQELDRRNKIAEEKAEREQREYEAKEKAERRAFGERVAGIELELSDPEGWNKSREVNSDSYGGAVLDYAEGWAKAMQLEITKGRAVAECADDTQYGLGFLGITGFQYGVAVSVLSQTWKHGEELRKWHNKKYGVSEEEKGTVNPAVFTIGV